MALRLVSNGYVHLALVLPCICHALALQASSLGPISTLEEIEAAVQQLPPAKRAEFRAWFLSFDASDWDQQMEDDLTTGKLDWLANEAISDSQAGRCSEL